MARSSWDERDGPEHRTVFEPSPTTLVASSRAAGVPLSELKRLIQSEAIARALRMTEGNVAKAAKALGMRRPVVLRP